MDIVFEGVTVTQGERTILQDVNGVAHAGQVLAVMGPSGELCQCARAIARVLWCMCV